MPCRRPARSDRQVSDVIRILESHAPSSTSESWDNAGLLVGDPSWETEEVVVCIDLTKEAIAAARKAGYRLIVNHHPCIFPKSRGLSTIKAGRGKESLVFEAIRHGIAVAAYHTGFDRCALEVVEKISSGLGVTPKGRLFDHARGTLSKLVVYVPKTHEEDVRASLAEAGAGHLGNYDSCSFVSEGKGRFRGSEASRPFFGKPGKLEIAAEMRIETIFPRGLERSVVEAMRAAHPYEEIAYDIYPVEQAPSRVGLAKGVGYGFWGEFARPKPFSEVVKDVKTLFQANEFQLTEPAPRSVRRLAFAAGKGSSVVDSAAEAGCDLLITGEVDYHDALRAAPMAVLELGHRESERFFTSVVGDWISAAGWKSLPLDVRTQRIYSSYTKKGNS